MNMRSLTYSAISFALLLQTAAAQPRFQAVPAGARAPAAIIVACKDYQTLSPLSHTVDSAVALAKALAANAYQVTVVTESSSMDLVLKGLPGLPAGSVISGDDAGQVDAALRQWLQSQFDGNAPAPFGLCVFTGHGEARLGALGDDTFYMTQNDVPGIGGVSINALKTDVGRRRLPIVLILDCCRKEIDRQWKERSLPTIEAVRLNLRGDDEVYRFRGNRFQLKGSMSDPASIAPVTTFWATPYGQPALDAKQNLLSLLADGLGPGEKRATMFKAREHREQFRDLRMGDDSPLESAEDLSLLTWFAYVQQAIGRAHENTQACQLDEGYVDQMMICATRNKQSRVEPPPMNLLHYWGNFAPNGLIGSKDEQGVRIQRQSGAAINTLVASAFLTEAFDRQNHTLIVELTAVPNGMPPATPLQLYIQPGDVSVQYGEISSLWNRPLNLKYGVTTRFALPLDKRPELQFKSLAISAVVGNESAWPEEAAVVVSRVLLVDNKTAKALPEREMLNTVDLFARWWDSDVIPDKTPPFVSCEKEILANKQRVLTMSFEANGQGQTTGKGGVVYRPPYLDKNRYQLRVVLSDFQPLAGVAEPASVKLSVRMQDKALVTADLKLKKGLTQDFPIQESGFPDYIGLVGTNATKIKLSYMMLVPLKNR